MTARRPKPKAMRKEASLYDALVDEFLPWVEVDHEDWHRRMEKLHQELDKAHGTSPVGGTGTS